MAYQEIEQDAGSVLVFAACKKDHAFQRCARSCFAGPEKACVCDKINRKRETTAPPGLPARLARSLPLAIYVYGTLNTMIKFY